MEPVGGEKALAMVQRDRELNVFYLGPVPTWYVFAEQ